MDIIDTEKRLNDAIKNGTEADVNYWRGYLDAVKAMRSRGKEVSGPCTTSNRLQEISKAEMDGRLVVLPCKVGDKVWVIMENREIYSFVVRGISMSATCDDTILRFSNSFQWGSNLGKTWFLTREEAEETLRKESFQSKRKDVKRNEPL